MQADLEAEIAIHNSNTDKMREFILKLIETGKHEAESMLEALNVKHRDNAFLDAIKNTSPGTLYPKLGRNCIVFRCTV